MKKRILIPQNLDDIAKKEWKRVLKILEDEGNPLDDKDFKILEGYCVNYSNWIKFEKLAEEVGYLIFSSNGYPQQHPYCQLAKNSQTQYLNFAKELGLSKASRSKIDKNKGISSTDGFSEEDLEMEKMFNG